MQLQLLRRLRRRTTSGNWVPEIDGLRFVAIFAVILYHLQGEARHAGYHPVQARYAWLDQLIGSGYRGVQLFFVISAYILGRPFASHHLFGKQRPSLRKYFLRRLTRIEPPYFLNLVISSIGGWFLFHPHLSNLLVRMAAGFVYSHYLFLRLFHQYPYPVNAVFWSLEVEVQFYILAPFLCLVFLIKNAPLRRCLLIASMFGVAALQMAGHWTPITFLGQAQYFLAGLLLVDIMLTTAKHWPHSWPWDLVSAIGWPLAFWLPQRTEGYWLAPLIVLLYIAAFRGRLVYRFLRLPWIATIGGMCYTIYLWHPAAMSLAEHALNRVDHLMPADYALYFLVQFTLKILAIAALSIPLFLVVEKPCMDPDWPRKLWLRLTAKRPPPKRPSIVDNAPALD